MDRTRAHWITCFSDSNLIPGSPACNRTTTYRSSNIRLGRNAYQYHTAESTCSNRPPVTPEPPENIPEESGSRASTAGAKLGQASRSGAQHFMPFLEKLCGIWEVCSWPASSACGFQNHLRLRIMFEIEATGRWPLQRDATSKWRLPYDADEMNVN